MDRLEARNRADLRDYLRLLRRRRLAIIVCFTVTTLVAVSYAFSEAATFTATATVLVPQQQASSVLSGQSTQLQSATDMQRYLADQRQFAQGDAVRESATESLGFGAPVTVATSLNSDVLSFTGAAGTGSSAARIANAYAHAYLAASRAAQVDQYAQQITALQRSIAGLRAKLAALAPGDPQQAPLQQAIDTLTQTVEQTQAATQLTNQAGPSLLDAATPPPVPSSPHKLLDGLLGAIVGLLLGLGTAFLWERLDDGINSRETAEEVAAGRPILAYLPYVDSWQSRESNHLALDDDPNSPSAEAYRTFRTSIQFLDIAAAQRVIGITSSIAGEGKTTAIANLALSFAKAGSDVVVISADLRRPKIHEYFGLGNAEGLTSILLGNASLVDVLQSAPVDPRVRVLASGPIPPNPAEVLGSDLMTQIVGDSLKHADIVLIDCPPVLPVSDALILTRLVDSMIVLAAARRTSRRQLLRSIQVLEQVHATVSGLVINKVRAGDSSGYAYSYSYHGYGERTAAAEGPSRDFSLLSQRIAGAVGPNVQQSEDGIR